MVHARAHDQVVPVRVLFFFSLPSGLQRLSRPPKAPHYARDLKHVSRTGEDDLDDVLSEVEEVPKSKKKKKAKKSSRESRSSKRQRPIREVSF